MLLALDTATRHSGLALCDGQRILAELNWHSADGQTTELAPRLSQILAWQGVTVGDLRALAVGMGPGSFTGLRVALSMAKGMALAHGLPLVGVPTLDATAYPWLHPTGVVCALVQAGRGRVCWALYAADAAALPTDRTAVGLGRWQGWRTPYRLGTVAELAAMVEQPATFCGEVPAATRRALAETLGERARLPQDGLLPRRAGDLAWLGWQRVQAGERDDPDSLSPIYLQGP